MMNGSSTNVPRRLPVRAALALGVLAALACAALLPAVAAPQATAAPATTLAPPAAKQRAPMVAIVLSPFLTWSDLSPTSTPALWSLAEKGAVGNMNSITGDPRWPTVAGGALTLSAARWAASASDAPGTPAALDAARRANASSLAVPTLGALGDAIHAAGGHTAAVGDGDTDVSIPSGRCSPAALVVTDGRGGVDFSATSSSLLANDAAAAFGVRSDPAQLRAAVASEVAQLETAGGPALLAIDPGDLSRAHAATASPSVIARRHADAVAGLDAAVAGLALALPSDAVLLVVTPATDKPYYEPPYFGPTIAVGPRLAGELTSSSTHRPGLVANLDVAPTILASLGIPRPPTMVGQPMTAENNVAPLAGRVARLSRIGTSAGAVDKLRDLWFIQLFVLTTLVVLAACVALALVPGFRRARFLGRWGVLLALAVPAGAWMMFTLNLLPSTPAAALSSFAIATVVVFGVALMLSLVRGFAPELPLLFLAVLTSMLIGADQWLGHPIESGLFSYSIRAGWRYYGMGNEGSALLVGASLAAVGIACDLLDGQWGGAAARRYGVPLVGVVVLLTAAAPFAGANAGVAVWGLIAFAIAWVRINRLRFTWKTAAGTVAAIVVLVGGLVALDLMRGSGSETHLGRFFAGAVAGGPRAVWELVYRKAANNLGYVRQTPYTWLAVGLVTALALTRYVAPRPLARALATRPGYAGALLGVLVGGVAALLTEDSGIVMPALMLFAGALPGLYVALLSIGAGADVSDERTAET